MNKRIKEWDEYFGIHCHLPAGAIRDLFECIYAQQEEIEQLSSDLKAAQEPIGSCISIPAFDT